MKTQEVVTILTEIPVEKDLKQALFLKTYPELNTYFEKGMYIETFTQSHISEGKILLTFIFRYHHSSASKSD